MSEGLKQVLAKPIQLADQVTKLAEEVQGSRQECGDLKSKAEKLASLLRQAARADLFERPTRRILHDTSQALEKALTLVSKCRSQQGSIVRRVFNIVPAASFKKMSSLLENSIGDVSWLLSVSKSSSDDDYDGWLGLAPIATNEPYLCFIWEQIAKLQKGSSEDKADAAAALLSFAGDNDRYGKLIIEEGGVGPLLKLLKEGRVEGQENAVRALGLLGRDTESVETMVQSHGACSIFAKVLKEGHMKVQAVVAWAVAEFAKQYPNCQGVFAQNHVVRLLVGHLAFETVQEHSKYLIQPKANSIHSVVVDGQNTVVGDDDGVVLVKNPGGKHGQMHSVVQSTIAKKHLHHQQQQVGLSGSSIRGRENEDPAVKIQLKVMAARALWQLSKGNSEICKSITESRALLCFAVLLEKGQEDVQYNSAMAVMEIARVAERDADLRRYAFKPSSLAAKAVVDQLVRIVAKADYSNLLLPCIMSLGCLSRTFRATESRVIGPLVCLLDETELEVTKEAVIALTKFACTDNYLHKDHSKAIIAEGGAKHLVQLVYFGEKGVQIPALILLCYIALHVPDSEELAQAKVLPVLEWASKQAFLAQDATVDAILPDTKAKLELYQSRRS